jgi:hypothetical protein
MGNGNTEIKKVTINGSFGSRVMVAMPRNKYANTYVHHDIDSISFVVEASPGAMIFINEKQIEASVPSFETSLECGRNLFKIKAVSPDGDSEHSIELKVFRAFPSPVWKKVIDHAPWVPRDSAGELVYKNRIWLFGGYIPQTVNDVWSTSDGIEWIRHNDVPSSVGIDIPVALNYKDKIYLFDIAGILYSTTDGNTWEVVSDQTPFTGRHHMGGAVFQGKMWVMGGVKDKTIYNDVWSSTDGVNWTLELEEAPWCKRQIHHTPLVYDDKMWLFGGGVMGSSYFPFIAYNDVWCTSDGIHWELKTANAPWPARIWGSTVVYKNRMWMIAGYRSEPESRHFGDAWYSVDGANWTEFKQHASDWKKASGTVPVTVETPMWEDRHESSVTVLNDTLYLMGGMIWPLRNDVWKLKIDALCFLTQPRFESYVDCLYEYHAFADFAASGQKAKYRLINPPEWLSIDSDTGRVYGIPKEPFHSTVTIEAYDDFGETARQEYFLDIVPLN